MNALYDLTPFLKEEGKEEISDIDMISFLVCLPYEDKDKMKEYLVEAEKKYSFFMKKYFPSISLSPFEEEIPVSESFLKMIQSFVLFTIDKKNNVSSMLLSFRYFLSLI